MPFTPEDVRENRDFFAAKLAAEKQKIDVQRRVNGENVGDFLIVDVRPRDAFAKSHVKGAWNVPFAEIDALAAQLPRDRELVLYCWSHF